MKIAHLADLHLGYRAYHRSTSRGVNQREADVAEAFRRAVAQVAELRPDLVLIAGDVFHAVRPGNTSIAEAFRQLSVLTERLPGVPVVTIAGNHDSPRSVDTGNILCLFREIENVHVVFEECSPVKLRDLDTTVLCMPHVSLSAAHQTAMDPDPRAKHNILLLHGEITDSNGEPRYRSEFGGAQVPETAVRADRWTYVALGHHHEAVSLSRNQWYAGAIERTSAFIWQEKAPKGFLVYDTETERTAFHEVETRALVDLPWIEAKGLSAAEVDERIRTAVESLEGGIDGKMVRQVVADVPRAIVRELNHRRVREWKAEALHFHLDPRPPQIRRRVAAGAPTRRLTLKEQVESFLGRWEPTREQIDGPELVRMGADYVERAGEAA
ncbi:Calcineurin-like phosphoesterase [bacterium JGI 053]|nr:Calcineurin-like phosphoesterase [bacterium JGI 053]